MICFDLETFPFYPGMPCPQMVCLAWADGDIGKTGLLVPWEGESPYAWLERVLKDKERYPLILNQNIVYDLLIMAEEAPNLVPLIFEAYEDGRLRCTKVRQQLLDIALGVLHAPADEDEDPDDEETEKKTKKRRRSLAALAKQWLGEHLEKEDTWRKRYAELWKVALKDWPKDAIDYPILDTITALKVYAAQEKYIQSPAGRELFLDGIIHGEIEENRAAWNLGCMKAWGIRTDGERITILKTQLEKEVAESTEKLLGCGIMRVGGTKKNPKPVTTKAELQRRVQVAFSAKGEAVPMTNPSKKFPEGQIKTSRKICEWSLDPELRIYADSTAARKLLSTYVPMLLRGATVPINPDYNVLVETCRPSCSNPNLLNPPRSGGVRECFIPRAGNVFLGADFDAAEMRSWAQVCYDLFGYSTLLEAFKKGEDPHLRVAAELLRILIEEAKERYAAGDKVVDETRQFSKEPNFGFMGLMGWKKFRERAALKDIFLSEEQSKNTRETWFRTWQEASDWKAFIERNFGDMPGTLRHPRTGFVRGEVGYSDGANTFFQHLTARGAKHAMWLVAKECYCDRTSPLFGARPVVFLYDELILEIRDARAAAGAARLQELMKAGMQKWTPDVPVACTPVLTRRWLKAAKPVFVDGMLVPGKPVKVDGKTKWVSDAV